MELYQKLYLRLFNRVTDALELLRQGDAAAAEALLIRAQQEAEETYISAEDDAIP